MRGPQPATRRLVAVTVAVGLAIATGAGTSGGSASSLAGDHVVPLAAIEPTDGRLEADLEALAVSRHPRRRSLGSRVISRRTVESISSSRSCSDVHDVA